MCDCRTCPHLHSLRLRKLLRLFQLRKTQRRPISFLHDPRTIELPVPSPSAKATDHVRASLGRVQLGSAYLAGGLALENHGYFDNFWLLSSLLLPFVKLHSRRVAIYVHHSSCSVQLLQQTPVENSRLHSIDPTVPVRKLALLSRMNATPKNRRKREGKSVRKVKCSTVVQCPRIAKERS